ADDDRAAVATALVSQLGAARLDAQRIATAPAATRALLGAARASHIGYRRRGRATIGSAAGTAWAIHTLAGGAPSGLVSVCGDAPIATLVAQQSTARGGVMTLAALGPCSAALVSAGSGLELASAV